MERRHAIAKPMVGRRGGAGAFTWLPAAPYALSGACADGLAPAAHSPGKEERRERESAAQTKKKRFVFFDWQSDNESRTRKYALASAASQPLPPLPTPHTHPLMPPLKLSLLDGDDGSDGDAGTAAPVKLRVNESFAKRLEVRKMPALKTGRTCTCTTTPSPRWSRDAGGAGAQRVCRTAICQLSSSLPPSPPNSTTNGVKSGTGSRRRTRN